MQVFSPIKVKEEDDSKFIFFFFNDEHPQKVLFPILFKEEGLNTSNNDEKFWKEPSFGVLFVFAFNLTNSISMFDI